MLARLPLQIGNKPESSVVAVYPHMWRLLPTLQLSTCHFSLLAAHSLGRHFFGSYFLYFVTEHFENEEKNIGGRLTC